MAKEGADKVEREKRKAEKDLEDEHGGAGVYSASLKKHYILANEEWKEDILPEFLDGHNVFDFVDLDILQRLEELEREEWIRMADAAEEEFEMDGDELTRAEKEALAEIRKKKGVLIQEHGIKKSNASSRPIVPRKFDKDRLFNTKRMGRQLSKLGIDRVRSKSRGRKRERSAGMDIDGDAMDMDDEQSAKKKLRTLSRPRSRSRSRPPTQVIPGEGLRDSHQKGKAIKKAYKSVKNRNKNARKGEADRTIVNLRPKHLLPGKRSTGKTNRR